MWLSTTLLAYGVVTGLALLSFKAAAQPAAAVDARATDDTYRA